MSPSVAEAFAELLRADATAAVAWTASGTVSRGDLDQRARAIAELLRGIPAGRRIGLCVQNGATFLAAFLAMARRGDAAVLLDAADPRAPHVALASQLGAAPVLGDTPQLLLHAAGGQALAERDRAVKLTSGTTGEATAIAVGDAELLADATALEATMGIGAHDRVLAAVPMSFSYGVGNLLVPALALGRCLVLPSAGPLGLLRALRVAEPTVLPAVPALLRALLQGSLAMPSSMRLVISAGAKLPPEVAVMFRERFQLPVHAFYGSTESGGVCYDQTGRAAERGAVGTPVQGVEIRIVPDGRVEIRSAAVGRVLATAGTGDSAPANPQQGCFLAPDLGALVAGELVLQGRVGAVFDVGGHKVDPHQLEGWIRQLPEVTDVSVLPFRDLHGRAVCAAVVAGTDIQVDDVRRHCARVMPAAKVPRCVLVVRDMPRCSRGKVSREALQQLLQQQFRCEQLDRESLS